MITRAQRLKATQKAYEEWYEMTPFVTEFEASDEDESKFVEILMEVDPHLKKVAVATAGEGEKGRGRSMAMTKEKMIAFDAKLNKVYFASWNKSENTEGGNIYIVAKSLAKAKRKGNAWLKKRAPEAEFDVFKEYILF